MCAQRILVHDSGNSYGDYIHCHRRPSQELYRGKNVCLYLFLSLVIDITGGFTFLEPCIQKSKRYVWRLSDPHYLKSVTHACES